MMRWLPRIGWIDIPTELALELGLDQAARWPWQVLMVEWLGFGICCVARVRP